jgi:hypothetical protein
LQHIADLKAVLVCPQYLATYVLEDGRLKQSFSLSTQYLATYVLEDSRLKNEVLVCPHTISQHTYLKVLFKQGAIQLTGGHEIQNSMSSLSIQYGNWQSNCCIK